MAPRSRRLIGRAAALIRGSHSLLLSSEEPSRVKTRQRGPTNYQLTPCFQPPPPFSLSISLSQSVPPFCLCPTHTAVLQDGSRRLTGAAADLIKFTPAYSRIQNPAFIKFIKLHPGRSGYYICRYTWKPPANVPNA